MQATKERGGLEPGTDARLNAVVLSHFKGGFNYAQTQKAPYGITKPGEATKDDPQRSTPPYHS